MHKPAIPVITALIIAASIGGYFICGKFAFSEPSAGNAYLDISVATSKSIEIFLDEEGTINSENKEINLPILHVSGPSVRLIELNKL